MSESERVSAVLQGKRGEIDVGHEIVEFRSGGPALDRTTRGEALHSSFNRPII